MLRRVRMALYTPVPLEPAWQGVLTRTATRTTDPKAFAIMVARMSRKYLGEEVDLARGDELLARLLFWFPRDLPKIALPLAELALTRALPARPLRVLDVGAGLGATSIGLVRALSAFENVRLASIDALDRDRDALNWFERLWSEVTRARMFPVLPELKTHVGDLSDWSSLKKTDVSEPYDLIVVGNALVEVTRGLGDEVARGEAIAAHVQKLIHEAPLAHDGALIVVEPATRPETRALHHARSQLLQRGIGVFAPCTHSGTCPMLARERDWCHEDLAVNLPEWLWPVAREAGLRWEGLTFSYLTVRKDSGRSIRERAEVEAIPTRIVSNPRGTKGKTEAFGCGPFVDSTGPRLMQLDRDVKGAHEATMLESCSRGDVVGIAMSAIEHHEAGKPMRIRTDELINSRRVDRTQ